MTAGQTLKLVAIAKKYFHDEADAQAFVTEIETVVTDKFTAETGVLATKSDIKSLEIKLQEGFKDQLKWMLITMISFLALLIAAIKLF